MDSIVICVIGVSGAGKTTVARALKELDPENFHLPISTTTRSPRPAEKDGEDYHFVTEEEFKDYVEKDEFMEWASYNDHLYGPHVSEFSRAPVTLHVTEEEGALQLRERIGAEIILLIPPSEDILVKRLLADRGDEAHIIERLRLDVKRKEYLRQIADYLIINDQFENTLVEMQNYIKLVKRLNAK